MRTFSSLLEVTFIGIRMACRIRYRTTFVPLCIGCVSLCHREGGSYICLSSESNGPNLLDKPLKGFIVNPLRMARGRFQVGYPWVSGLVGSGSGMISHPRFSGSGPRNQSGSVSGSVFPRGYPMDIRNKSFGIKTHVL